MGRKMAVMAAGRLGTGRRVISRQAGDAAAAAAVNRRCRAVPPALVSAVSGAASGR